jgi:hypothetical protein
MAMRAEFMTTRSLPKPSAEDRARSARVRQRLADFAHECNVNAGVALPKKRKREGKQA